eukprot:NODE_309_length_10065_cov_0.706101.p6 type:complete len:268 gc:universal NODE_309_length_10065_cov_0.706101:6645-5842(-)
MNNHHFGQLLKKSSIASFNHHQSYTTRNLIDQAYGRIGKHVSPLKYARVISLDSEYGIPFVKSTEMKAMQLKFYQENFNVDNKIENNKNRAWEIIEKLEAKKDATNSNENQDFRINHVKLSENLFKKLKKIVSEKGKTDKFRKDAIFDRLNQIVKLDDTHETTVNLPIAKPTENSSTDFVDVSEKVAFGRSQMEEVVNCGGFISKASSGLSNKGYTKAVVATSKGFVPYIQRVNNMRIVGNKRAVGASTDSRKYTRIMAQKKRDSRE